MGARRRKIMEKETGREEQRRGLGERNRAEGWERGTEQRAGREEQSRGLVERNRAEGW